MKYNITEENTKEKRLDKLMGISRKKSSRWLKKQNLAIIVCLEKDYPITKWIMDLKRKKFKSDISKKLGQKSE